MKKHVLFASLLTIPAANAVAEPAFYGRANVSFELVDEAGGNTDTELSSNASRLGVKGTEQLNEAYKVIYQLEYGVDFDDKDTFSQRNIFIGLQSDWGAVIAGHFDTPFKRAQGDVDLFNDLRGDIKTITPHDNRESNSVMYSTPESFGPFAANVAYISSEEEGRDDGKSASVAYEANGLYAAVALDQDVEQEDAEAARFATTYSFDAWQLGALLEVTDPAVGDSESGWLLSGKYSVNQWAFKAQGGSGYQYSGDMLEEVDTLSLGVDYRFAKNAKAFTFYTANESEGESTEHYLGAGFELRF